VRNSWLLDLSPYGGVRRGVEFVEDFGLPAIDEIDGFLLQELLMLVMQSLREGLELRLG